MFAEERQAQILEQVRAHRQVTVPALARAFRVTTATIRTDLRDLERAGHVVRTHGGALARTKAGFELDSAHRQVQQLPEKQRIARAALALIEDSDTILLDTGTTTLELAKLIEQRQNLTVVTNDLDIARLLERSEAVQVLLLGGLVRRGFHCTIGVPGQVLVAGLMVDKAFMAANGFSPAHGATTPDLQQAATKRQMIACANRVILLCDHTKHERDSFAQFARVEDIDTLVTDQLPAGRRKAYTRCGLDIILAGR